MSRCALKFVVPIDLVSIVRVIQPQVTSVGNVVILFLTTVNRSSRMSCSDNLATSSLRISSTASLNQPY